MDSIGNRLKFIRGKQSGEDFSKLLTIHPQTIYRYERGERKPDLDFVQLVANKTGFCIEWIITGEGPMHPSDLSTPTQQAITQPQTMPIESCARCLKLEAKLERIESQRDELAAENRKLWKENGDLREENATLRAQPREGQNTLFDKSRKLSGTSEVMQSRP